MTNDTCANLAVFVISFLFGWYVLGPLLVDLPRLRDAIVHRCTRAVLRYVEWRRSRDYMAIYRSALRDPIDYHYAVRRLTAQTAYTAVAFRSIGLSADEAVKAFQRVADALSQHMQEKM